VNDSGVGVVRASFFNGVDRRWSEPATVSDGQSEASEAAVAAAFDGPRAAWVQRAADGTSSVWSARLVTPPSGWDAPQKIGTSTGSPIGRPRIAAGGSDFFVLWIQEDRAFANRFPGQLAQWGTARSIQRNALKATAPALAADASGHAVALWAEWTIGTDLVASDFDASSGSGWSAPTRVSATEGVLKSSERPSCTFLGQEAICAWTLFFSPEIRWSRIQRGAGWTPSEVLWTSPRFRPNTENFAGQPDFPRLAVLGAGMLAVWQSGEELWSAPYQPSTGWGTAELLGSTLTPRPTYANGVEQETDLAGTASVTGASMGLPWPSVGIVVWEQPVSRESIGRSLWARTYR
jgi:hypothetical protein